MGAESLEKAQAKKKGVLSFAMRKEGAMGLVEGRLQKDKK
jgi:hypothetical protein